MRFHVTRKRRNKNNINNRIDDNRNVKHLKKLTFALAERRGEFFDEVFMFEVHISTTLKIYSNWHIKTFIPRGDHDDAKQK